MPAIDTTGDGRRAGRALNGLTRAARPELVLAVGLPLVSGALLVGQVALLARILDAIAAIRSPVAGLVGPIAALAGLMLVRLGLGVAAEIAGDAAAQTVKTRLRDALFARLLAMRPDALKTHSSGAIATTIIEQTEALDGFVARYLPAMIQASLLPPAFAVIVFPLDWVAGLLFLVSAPLIPLFMALVGWGAEAASRQQATALARLSGRFADRLRGLVTLKLFDRAQAETEAIVEASEDLRRRTMRVLSIAFLSSAVLEFFAAIGVAGIALYVGLSLLGLIALRAAPLTLETGLFLLLMAPEIYNPLRLLAAHYHDRAAALAAIGAIEAEFGALPDIAVPPVSPSEAGAPVSGVRAQAVTARNLHLAAAGSGRVLLENAALEVAAGQHVAIIGPSGAGKTSFLIALAGLAHHEGLLALDGTPVRDLPDTVLRRAIAMVPQRPVLLAGTIADNIRLGRPEASDHAVARAAGLALVDEFAAPLPEGIATRIGDSGLGLSGGQAHRVGLARLFLRDPGLILLDEPTAHLDTETGRRLLDNVFAFARGRTMILVTHSDAVAARADRVFRLAGRQLLPTPIHHAATVESRRGVA